MPPVELFVSTEKKGGFSIILNEGGQDQKEGMLNGKMFQLSCTVVVDDDLSVLLHSENLLALSGRGEVSQGGFSQLQAASIEAIGTIDVDGTSDVIDVVKNERTTIEEYRTTRWVLEDSFGQLGRCYRPRPLENQLLLEAVALGAWTRGKADRLQFAAFRRRQRMELMVLMVVMMMQMMVMEVMVVVMIGTLVYAAAGGAAGAAGAAGATDAAGDVGDTANVGDATVDAAGSRGTRRYGRRRCRRREEARGRRRRTWLAQTAVQNEFEIVSRPPGRDRGLATHQSRHRRSCRRPRFLLLFLFILLLVFLSLLVTLTRQNFVIFLLLPVATEINVG